MEFALDQEQQTLRDTARRLMNQFSGSQEVRAAMATSLGYDTALWSQVAGEMGWAGITIPEEYGGIGLGQVELSIVFEEAGRALFCSPLFSTVALGVNALLIGGSEAQKSEHLGAVAAGERTLAVAYKGPGGRWGPDGIEVRPTPIAAGYRLDGEAHCVVGGHGADWFIVATRAQGTRGATGVSLFLVPASARGLSCDPLVTVDQTRRLARLRFDGLVVGAKQLLGQQGKGGPVLAAALERGVISLAAEQLGGAERCLEMAVEYSETREQFGRPIGSFQAIKHKCAEMLLRVESSRSAAYYGAMAVDAGEPELPALASLAKAYCSESYFHCASENLQIHGGIGFTWEHDVHLHFKRARASEALLGSPDQHRERLGSFIGLDEAEPVWSAQR